MIEQTAEPAVRHRATDARSDADEQTQFLAALRSPCQSEDTHALVSNIELLGLCRLFFVQFNHPVDPSKACRVVLYPHVKDVLDTDLGGGAEIDFVDMVTIPDATSAKPIVQRVASILERRVEVTTVPRYVVVMDSGDVVSIPPAEKVVECEQYRLVFLSGRWISPTSTTKFSACVRSSGSHLEPV